MNSIEDMGAQTILNSLNDGVYVTDKDRKLIYWNQAAERITGWKAEDVEGLRCCDNLLNHLDKDNHSLCEEEYCPLYRAIVTEERSTYPLILFAKAKDGRRIPMQVSVAPIKDSNGITIGGVEVFRDLSEVYSQLERAKKIQASILTQNAPEDPRIQFRMHYIPFDIIGGDFYTIKQIGQRQYAVFLADVVGHGLSSALYTMHLKSMYDEYSSMLNEPCRFLENINKRLTDLFIQQHAFATGILCIIDIETNRLRFVSAGNPAPLLIRGNDSFTQMEIPGFPLGFMKDVTYSETQTRFQKEDRLFFYTDGAVEIRNAEKEILGEEGLINLLKSIGYPTAGSTMKDIESALLHYSNEIRLDDDLTFIEVYFP